MMSDERVPLSRPKINRFAFLREIVSTIVFFFAVFTLLQLTLPRSVVHGSSMMPNFTDGEYLVISRVHYLMGDPRRGDVVVFNVPGASPEDSSLIKRVVGLPNETVQIIDTIVHINGQPLDEPYILEPCTAFRCPDSEAPIQLGADEYFLLGDNRNVSDDSRNFGAVSRDHIIGEVLFRYWPLNQFGAVQPHRFGD